MSGRSPGTACFTAGVPVGRARLNGVPAGTIAAKGIYIGAINPGKTATVTWSFIASSSVTISTTDFNAQAGIGPNTAPSVGYFITLQPYR